MDFTFLYVLQCAVGIVSRNGKGGDGEEGMDRARRWHGDGRCAVRKRALALGPSIRQPARSRALLSPAGRASRSEEERGRQYTGNLLAY